MTVDSIRAELESIDTEIRARNHYGVRDLLDRRVQLFRDLRCAEHRFISRGITHTLTVEPEDDGWLFELSSWALDLSVGMLADDAIALAAALTSGTRFEVADVMTDASVTFELDPTRTAWAVVVRAGCDVRGARLTGGEAAELAAIIRERHQHA